MSTLGWILLILLILILVPVYPVWPHSVGWGYGPSGLIFIILVVVLILAITKRL